MDGLDVGWMLMALLDNYVIRDLYYIILLLYYVRCCMEALMLEIFGFIFQKRGGSSVAIHPYGLFRHTPIIAHNSLGLLVPTSAITYKYFHLQLLCGGDKTAKNKPFRMESNT